MPYIYCSVLLLLLFPYSFFITWQLYRWTVFELSVQKKYLNKLGSYSTDEFFYVLKVLSRKRMWLNSLRLAESHTNIPVKKQHYYFNFLGVIYQQMKEYDLAQLYYLMSLEKNKDYRVAITNLETLKSKVSST